MSSEFFDAIKKGSFEDVQRLLAATPGLIHEKESGLSPILVAMYHKETEIAEFLSDKAGNLSIFEAAAMGKLNQVTLLLARDPMLINAYADDGFQPLGLACYFGHYKTAEYLVKIGAAVNTPSRNALAATPLQSAVAGGRHKIVTLLLDRDADPNVREQNGFTPLHAAAQKGDADIIRTLLFNGANLTASSQNGKLPIDVALEAGHKEAAELLKEGITRRFRVRHPRS